MAMDKSSADSYLYSKMSGMLAKSFAGKNEHKLFEVKSLQELWSLVFKSEVPAVPETLLAKQIEKDASDKFISDFIGLLKNYSKPHPFLLSLLQFFDYENVKSAGAILAMQENKTPDFNNISPFNIIDYEKWPSLKKMTENGPLSWYDSAPELSKQSLVNYKLDRQYVTYLWKSLHKVDSQCRKELESLIKEKFSMENVVWALRLKIYYNYKNEDIIPLLAYSDGEVNADDPLVEDAMKIIDWDLSDAEKWSKWKHRDLLNPYADGTSWRVDPRWISNSFKRRYIKNAYRMFHKYPFTECPLVCWYILKRNELDDIRTVVESIRLGQWEALNG